ncbi:MAG: GspE/PulE family protein [Oligoflexales bacterium]
MSGSFKDVLKQKLGVSEASFMEAEKLAKEKNILLIHALVSLKLGEPVELLKIYANYYKIQAADLSSMDIQEEIINLIPREVAQKFKVLPIDRVGNNIIIAMANPTDLKLVDLVRFKTGYSVKPVLALESMLAPAIDKYYKLQTMDLSKYNTGSSGGAKPRGEKRAVIHDNAPAASNELAPIVRLVDQIMLQCVAREASDIHIEIYESFVRVRLRVDGVLQEIAKPPMEFASALTSRIKIMAGLDIAEKRLPQDGGIRVTIADKPIDFRVSSLPTIYGEKLVLRILDKSSLRVDMTELGFEQDDLKKFRESIYRPHGIVLVTGPTGSGKTTTLYSALADLNRTSDNIVTAEDPVEYNLEGINQVQINPQIGLEFSTVLRAFLRQDPDIIMVGEVRDRETGEIAIKAALTGHLVLSTLHTNSAADTVVRLQNMGLESFNLISALNCIVAQRLARKICSNCKMPDDSVNTEHLVALGIPAQKVSSFVPQRGKGCDRCSDTGYKGRTAMHEVMVINDAIREGIMRHASSSDLKRIAIEGGMRTMRQNALLKFMQGEIDLLEVTQNTAPDQEGEGFLSDNVA